MAKKEYFMEKITKIVYTSKEVYDMVDKELVSYEDYVRVIPIVKDPDCMNPDDWEIVHDKI